MNVTAKPFFQWVGGKTRLLDRIREYYPTDIKAYAEPFLGGGAVLFDVLSTFQPERVYVSDVNYKLVRAYLAVRDRIDDFIARLDAYKAAYLNVNDKDKEILYYQWRTRYNAYKEPLNEREQIDAGALFVVLTILCFNALYRVNSKGEFNASFGKHYSPTIYDEDNLRNASKLLQNVEIVCGTYQNSRAFIEECSKKFERQTFVYFDPPYRPLKKRESQYTPNSFTDDDQRELAKFFRHAASLNATVLESNSDPANENPDDDFFNRLYWGFYGIQVPINRNICADKSKRKLITEQLISNVYPRKRLDQKTLF